MGNWHKREQDTYLTQINSITAHNPTGGRSAECAAALWYCFPEVTGSCTLTIIRHGNTSVCFIRDPFASSLTLLHLSTSCQITSGKSGFNHCYTAKQETWKTGVMGKKTTKKTTSKYTNSLQCRLECKLYLIIFLYGKWLHESSLAASSRM